MRHSPALLLLSCLPLLAQSVVEGVVVESVAKSPVAGATVQVRYTKPPEGSGTMSVANTGPSARTDDAGHFRIEVESPSEFRFIVSKDGYSGVDSPGTRIITLEKDESRNGIVLALAAESALEGRVFDPELEKPVAGLPILIQQYMSVGGPMRFMPSGRSTTDAEGKYRVSGLKPGRYLLIAGPSQLPRVREPRGEAEPLMIYPSRYFPDSVDESGAMVIELLPGAQQTGMDFRLTRAKARRVRVEVSLTGGTPPKGQISLDRRIVLPTGMTVIAPLGVLDGPTAFEIEPLGHEIFELQASMNGGASGQQLHGVMSITPSSKDVDDAVLTLAPGVAITGALHSEGVKPDNRDPLWAAATKDVTVSYRSETYEPESGSAARAQVSRETGNWQLDDVFPSPLRIDVTGLPAGYAVTAMTYNGADVPIGRIDMSPGAMSHHVDIAVAAVTNSIKGIVTAAGKPVSDAIVFLVREPVAESAAGWRERRVMTETDGTYAVNTLEPGRYRVCAILLGGDHDTAIRCLRSMDSKRVEIGKTANVTINLDVP